MQGRYRVVARPALGKDGCREAGAQRQAGLTAREHALPPVPSDPLGSRHALSAQSQEKWKFR